MDIPRSAPSVFDVLAEIARTDKAIVYRAVDTGNGGTVALKLVQNDEEGRREIEMLRRVAAANNGAPRHVVRCLGGHACGHDLWIALEWFTETVERLDPAKMTPLALMSIALDAAKGLVEMDRAGVASDDVKPSNIAFRGGSGRVAHIDLGSARLRGEPPRGSTPDFAAPEILRGVPSGTSPCYGWARTMEYLATGRVGIGPEYRLDQLVPWAGRAFSELVADCLADRPQDRPSPRTLCNEVRSAFQDRRRCPRCGRVGFGDAGCSAGC